MDNIVRHFLKSKSFNKIIFSKRHFSIFFNLLSRNKYDPKEDYAKYYKSLGLPNESDQETVRQKFISLAKKFHPDSGSPEADTEKFQIVETAFRKLREKFWLERKRANESGGEYGLYYDEKKSDEIKVKERDIEHTAPQHRQYLSFDGVGSGTPSEREKQYQKYKAATAIENVYEHRINKLNAQDVQTPLVKNKQKAKDIKTRYGMDRLVEDLIQESMSRGEFDNLAGSGKPLPQKVDYNPYVDFTTHKLNQVLIDNGFAPEWITLQKEIREEKEFLIKEISDLKSKLGPENKWDRDDLATWNKHIKTWLKRTTQLNSKINKYNLLVPILIKQMFPFDLHDHCNKILLEENEKDMSKS